MTKDSSTAHIFVIIEGSVRLISSDKKYKSYATENKIATEFIESQKAIPVIADGKSSFKI